MIFTNCRSMYHLSYMRASVLLALRFSASIVARTFLRASGIASADAACMNVSDRMICMNADYRVHL